MSSGILWTVSTVVEAGPWESHRGAARAVARRGLSRKLRDADAEGPIRYVVSRDADCRYVVEAFAGRDAPWYARRRRLATRP